MSNKLKQIFNNNEIVYKGKISFKNKEDKADFDRLLKKVFEEGQTVRFDRETSLSCSIDDGYNSYPVDDFENVSNIMVGPSREKHSINIVVDNNPVEYFFYTYQIEGGFIVESLESSLYEIKMTFIEKDNTVNIKFTPHLEKVDGVNDALKDTKEIKSFFEKCFYTDEKYTDNNLAFLKRVIDKYLFVFDSLSYLENVFSLTFDLKQIDITKIEDFQTLFELDLAVRKKKVIRLNSKVNDSTLSNVDIKQIEQLKVGNPLLITFRKEIEYNLWGQTIKLYRAFYVGNVFVKKIENLENGDVHIIYGDHENSQMYMAFRGFATEKEANDALEQ